MAWNTFKIGNYALDDSKILTAKYDEPRKSEQYEWSWSTQVVFEWADYWLNLTENGMKQWNELWIKKWMDFKITRRALQGGKTFTELSIDWASVGNVQNTSKTSQSVNKSNPDSRELSIVAQSLMHIPWHYEVYRQTFPDNKFKDYVEVSIDQAKEFIEMINNQN